MNGIFVYHTFKLNNCSATPSPRKKIKVSFFTLKNTRFHCDHFQVWIPVVVFSLLPQSIINLRCKLIVFPLLPCTSRNNSVNLRAKQKASHRASTNEKNNNHILSHSRSCAHEYIASWLPTLYQFISHSRTNSVECGNKMRNVYSEATKPSGSEKRNKYINENDRKCKYENPSYLKRQRIARIKTQYSTPIR